VLSNNTLKLSFYDPGFEPGPPRSEIRRANTVLSKHLFEMKYQGLENETKRNETKRKKRKISRNETKRNGKKITKSRNETKRNGKPQETKRNVTILFRNEKNET
jgi:hypothetical protein